MRRCSVLFVFFSQIRRTPEGRTLKTNGAESSVLVVSDRELMAWRASERLVGSQHMWSAGGGPTIYSLALFPLEFLADEEPLFSLS